jgi:hypothetical protein
MAAGERGWVTAAIYRGDHWLRSYDGHWWAITASSDVVKWSRRVMITAKDVHHDDGRSAMSPAQVDGRQSGHSALSSSTARSFYQGLLSAQYRRESWRRRESELKVTGGEIWCICWSLSGTVPLGSHSDRLTELNEAPYSPIPVWQHDLRPAEKLLPYNPSLTLL